jgi:hypothetical protein
MMKTARLVLAWATLLAIAPLRADDKSAGGSENPAASTIRLRVRVTDRAGKPVANVKGVLFKMIPPRGQAARRNAEPAIVRAGTASLSKQGDLETQDLPTKAAYVLEAQAGGFAPELSRWTHPTQSGTIELPPIQLRRLVRIAGKVVDRKGRAIANAKVIQAGDAAKRLEAASDSNGNFRLDGVPEGRAIVCFDAAGCRFHGALLACPSEGNRIELERVDEANLRVLEFSKNPLPQMSATQRRELLKKILDPMIARVLAKSDVAENDLSILASAARLEPDRILPRLDSFKLAQPYMSNSIRYSIGYGLLEDGKPDAALEAVEKFKEPQSRAQAYLYWFYRDELKKKYPKAHRVALARAQELLKTQIKPPDNIYLLCELAAQLREVGDRAGANKVTENCQALLDKMPADARGRPFMRLELAIAVAPDDVERAKKLAADAEPGQRIRLASAIARTHAKEAERFLDDVPGDLSLMELNAAARNLPSLCLHVARQDPAAAERLLLKYARLPQPKTDAEKMFGIGGSFGLNLTKEFLDFQVAKLKASCYGLIAEGAFERDPVAARHALTVAIELVTPLREGFTHPLSQDYEGPSVLMAMLIPIAQRIDPALAREVFWRALSLRIAASGESRERQRIDNDTCLLANLVRYFDRDVAESLMEPVLARARSRTFGGIATYYWFVRSQAQESPERALAWADSLGDLPSAEGSSPRDTAKQVIINVLSYADDAASDPRERLKNELAGVQNAYSIYASR